jgi:Type IX secretion system protein PorV
MNKRLLIPCFILFFYQFSIAQKYSNEFLAIGVGARAHGMSGAVVATSNDVFSSYWNPAGLNAIESPFQIGAMHAEWFGGVAKYDYLGVVKPLNSAKKRVIGVSIIRMGIDQIPYTLNLVGADGSINYNNITEFSAADYAIQGSYAQAWKNVTIGGNLKVIRRIIGSFAGAWGVGADIGVQYNKDKWRFGAVGRDITTTYNAWTANLTEKEKQVFTSTGNAIPKSSVEITKPTLVLASAYVTPLSKKIDLTVEMDAGFTTDGQRNVLVSGKIFNLDPRLGFELEYQNMFWLRGGIGNFQRLKNEDDPTKKDLNFQPNIGIGLKLGRLTVDYALTNIGNVSQVLYSNIFSLKLDLKSRVK